MSNLAVISVLNVSDTWVSDRTFNGRVYSDNWVALDIQGGQIMCRFDPKLVEIPVGWTGRAVVECVVRQNHWVDENGKKRVSTYLSPSVITSFDKGFKHPDLNDIVTSLKK